MKLLSFLVCLFAYQLGFAQQNARIGFKNDYEDVYHLSLIIYTPDGKSQTRVSNLQPGELKEYAFPVGTEVFIADQKQEAFAMKGNDIKATGVKPSLTVNATQSGTPLILSSLAQANGWSKP